MLKILCLTSNDPGEPDCGGIVRARNVFRLLSKIGRVRLVLASDYQNDSLKPGSIHDGFELAAAFRFPPAAKWTFAEQLKNEFDPRFLNTHRIQARPAEREQLLRLMAEHDLVWIYSVKLVNMFGLWHWPRSVLDMDDIQSNYYLTELANTTNLIDRLRTRRQIRLWRRREKLLLKRVDAISVCSEPDLKTLNHLLGDSSRTFILPNSFTAPEHPPVRQLTSPPRIGFVGDFGFPPNAQGIEWFLEKVWPLILKARPDARLRLAGRAGGQKWPANQNIEPLGWVADMQSEMATWALSAVPIFVGGGTRIKTVESFSRKCPVVATPVGAFGYDVTHGQEILIADTPENFAAECLRILADPALGETLAENAWQKFLKKWTWDAQAERIKQVVTKIAGNQSSQ